MSWRISKRRRARSTVPVERRGLDGQRLDEQDSSYDSVLSTFTLCTIPDPSLALAEARRVLRPGGVLCVLEHGLAPDRSVETWQHRMEPLQRRLARGCHLTRDVKGLVTDAGFQVTHLETAYLNGPAFSRPWTYVYTFIARLGG